MDIVIGVALGFSAWFVVRFLVGRLLHRRPEPARGEDGFRAGAARGHRRPGRPHRRVAEDEDEGSAMPTRRCASFRPAGRISNGPGRHVL